SPQEAYLLEGQTTTLSVSWSPWNAEAQTVTWNSDNPDVATVNNGVVTAVGEGTATITAQAQVWDANAQNWVDSTDTAIIHVRSAETQLYGFVATAGGSSAMNWVTYTATNPRNTTAIGSSSHMWQGGAYYEGYLYTVEYPRNTGGMSAYVGTVVYRSKVE